MIWKQIVLKNFKTLTARTSWLKWHWKDEHKTHPRLHGLQRISACRHYRNRWHISKERINEKMRLVKNTCHKSWIYELLNACNHKNSIPNYYHLPNKSNYYFFSSKQSHLISKTFRKIRNGFSWEHVVSNNVGFSFVCSDLGDPKLARVCQKY